MAGVKVKLTKYERTTLRRLTRAKAAIQSARQKLRSFVEDRVRELDQFDDQLRKIEEEFNKQYCPVLIPEESDYNRPR
jgi:hypothetical protein